MASGQLSTLNPSDLLAIFQSNTDFNRYIGRSTVGGEIQPSLHYTNERPSALISEISGLEVAIKPEETFTEDRLFDGRKRRQRSLQLYVANYGGGDMVDFRKRLAGMFGPESISSEVVADYPAALGDTSGNAVVSSPSEALLYTLQAGAPVYTGRATQEPLDAPHDGVEYARVDGKWVQAGTASLDLSGYDTSAEVNAKVNTLRENAQSGYEFTGAFSDRVSGAAGANDLGSFVAYTGQMVADERWLRFGFSSAANQANDNEYWGETDPAYDNTKGLFGGLHMPPGVTQMFDFDYSDNVYSVASEGSLKYTAANGTIDFTGARPGDLALVRFDFNVIPQVANTTLEVAMIFATRDANDNITFTFPLTGEPLFYGTGTVGRTFLNRPTLSAYFASQEDVNARALLAIRADNPIQVAPLTTLVTLVR